MSGLCSVRSRRLARLPWRPLTVLLALTVLVVLVLGGAIDPLQSGALTMVPALALAVMMLTRPYLGERVIGRLRARRGRRRKPRKAARRALAAHVRTSLAAGV